MATKKKYWSVLRVLFIAVGVLVFLTIAGIPYFITFNPTSLSPFGYYFLLIELSYALGFIGLLFLLFHFVKFLFFCVFGKRELIKLQALLSLKYFLFILTVFAVTLLNTFVNYIFGFGMDIIAKPVIYLYPTLQTDALVKLSFDGTLTTTYPLISTDTTWKVTASPDGTLINHADSQQYQYLFWEGEPHNVSFDLSKGFVVPGNETVQFLQTTLAHLGLQPREYNDFIVYWLPHMERNPYNLIHFSFEEYEKLARLEVTPKPDTVLRVFMVFKPLKKKQTIAPQILPTVKRNGFTVVEWGGMQAY